MLGKYPVHRASQGQHATPSWTEWGVAVAAQHPVAVAVAPVAVTAQYEYPAAVLTGQEPEEAMRAQS